MDTPSSSDPVRNSSEYAYSNEWHDISPNSTSASEGARIDGSNEGANTLVSNGMQLHNSAHHHHRKFSFVNDVVEIKVEDTLFQIRSDLLINSSERFKNELGRLKARGTSFPWDLVGEGMTADAFAGLLEILSTPITSPVPNMEIEKWISVWHLAALWESDDVCKLAYKHLSENASPIDKIKLVRSFKALEQHADPASKTKLAWSSKVLEPCLMDAYLALCQRPGTLSQDDIQRLQSRAFSEGMQRVLSGDMQRVLAAREAGFRLAKPLQQCENEMQNHLFHKLFPSQIPAEDRLVAEYMCSFEGVGSLCGILGKLYVTWNYICFYEKLPGFSHVTEVVISFEDVTAIEKRNQKLVAPLAIRIKTRMQEYSALSLVARDATFDVLYGAWLQYRVRSSLDLPHGA